MIKDWIRGQLRKWRTMRLLKRDFQTTRHGFKFAGPSAMMAGDFEPEETRLIIELLKQTDTFVNVGANFGYYVCLARSLGVPATAIEPVPLNVSLLEKNLVANGFQDDVEVFQIACGEENGSITIFGTGTGASVLEGWARNPNSLSTDVELRRLDDVVPVSKVSKKSLFLIDVEGFELEVLKGATKLIGGQEKPLFIIESGFSDHRQGGALNENFAKLAQVFHDNGYTVRRADETLENVPLSLMDQSMTQKEDLVGCLNFFFAPSDFDVSRLQELRR